MNEVKRREAIIYRQVWKNSKITKLMEGSVLKVFLTVKQSVNSQRQQYTISLKPF